MHPRAGDAGQRLLRHEARAAGGQDRRDLGAVLAQQPDQLERLVGGDAAGDDQQDLAAGEVMVAEPSPPCRRGRRACLDSGMATPLASPCRMSGRRGGRRSPAMEWNDLQRTARTRGQLVFAMRQSQTPAMTQPGPWGTSTDGYCIGLAATWISRCYAGKTFPVDGDKVCDNPPWNRRMSQTLSDATAARAGRTSGRRRPSRSSAPVRRAARAARNQPDCRLHLLHRDEGLWLLRRHAAAERGAHAIALRHGRDNRMHLFDANNGHFAVRDHTLLKSFLTWFLSTTGYDTRYDQGTCIVGVTPPIGAEDAPGTRAARSVKTRRAGTLASRATAASRYGWPRSRPRGCGAPPAPARPPASSRPASPGPGTCGCSRPGIGSSRASLRHARAEARQHAEGPGIVERRQRRDLHAARIPGSGSARPAAARGGPRAAPRPCRCSCAGRRRSRPSPRCGRAAAGARHRRTAKLDAPDEAAVQRALLRHLQHRRVDVGQDHPPGAALPARRRRCRRCRRRGRAASPAGRRAMAVTKMRFQTRWMPSDIRSFIRS